MLRIELLGLCGLAVTSAGADAVGTPVVLSDPDLQALVRTLPKDAAGSNKVLADRGRHRIQIARVVDRDGPAEVHASGADIFVVLAGKGKLMLGGTLDNPREVRTGEQQAARAIGAKEIVLQKGTVVEVPAGTAHQILAKGTEVSYLVIKIP